MAVAGLTCLSHAVTHLDDTAPGLAESSQDVVLVRGESLEGERGRGHGTGQSDAQGNLP